MHIKRKNGVITMSELVVCPKYDMNHFKNDFTQNDNRFKCNYCGTVIEAKEPVLVQDDKGRLRVQIEVEVVE